MDLASIRDPLSTLNSLLFFLEDSSDNEDEDLSRVLKLLTERANNKNAQVFGRKKRGENVKVQTDPETDEISNSWVSEAERKIDILCAQLSNLENILYHTQNRVYKTKNKPLSSSIPKNTQSGNFSSKSSGCSKAPGVGNDHLEDALLFELINNRLRHALESALDLKKSVPKVDLEKLCSDGHEKYQIIESTIFKETNILRLERSKSSICKTTSLPHQVYKRERTLPTISESKFRHPSQMHPPNAKIESKCYVPKTKNVVKAQKSAPEVFRQTCTTQERDNQFQDSNVPTRDTGAIPKHRDAKRVTSTNVTVRTHKTKKTSVKPLWR